MKEIDGLTSTLGLASGRDRIFPAPLVRSMSSSQNVQVCVRIRPLTANELLADAAECVFTMDDKPVVAVGLGSSAQGKRSFTFDNVLGTVSTQDELYESCVSPLMKKFQEGIYVSMLCQPSSALPLLQATMQLLLLTAKLAAERHFPWALAWVYSPLPNSNSFVSAIEESIGNEGIVPRFIRRLFEHLNFKTDANPNGYKSSVSVTFLELYNEELIDLLNPRPQSASEAGWGGLSIREDGNGNIVWTGVREETVANREELMQCLQKGSLCRTTGSTDMNASSSRSHAIFTIILKQEVWMPKGYSNGNILSFDNNEQFNPTNAAAGGWSTFNSKFHFVDLAGSERLKRTNAAGGRKKEGISINQGLLSLGNVISALGDENRKVCRRGISYLSAPLYSLPMSRFVIQNSHAYSRILSEETAKRSCLPVSHPAIPIMVKRYLPFNMRIGLGTLKTRFP